MSESNFWTFSFGRWSISFSLTLPRGKHAKIPPKVMVGENRRRAVDDDIAE